MPHQDRINPCRKPIETALPTAIRATQFEAIAPAVNADIVGHQGGFPAHSFQSDGALNIAGGDNEPPLNPSARPTRFQFESF